MFDTVPLLVVDPSPYKFPPLVLTSPSLLIFSQPKQFFLEPPIQNIFQKTQFLGPKNLPNLPKNVLFCKNLPGAQEFNQNRTFIKFYERY